MVERIFRLVYTFKRGVLKPRCSLYTQSICCFSYKVHILWPTRLLLKSVAIIFSHFLLYFFRTSFCAIVPLAQSFQGKKKQNNVLLLSMDQPMEQESRRDSTRATKAIAGFSGLHQHLASIRTTRQFAEQRPRAPRFIVRCNSLFVRKGPLFFTLLK